MKNQNNQNEHWEVLIFLLDEIRKQKGITHDQVAEMTGYERPSISRFFAAKFKPSLPLFLDISKAIGVNFFFEDKDSISDLNRAMELAKERLGRRPDKLPKN